MKCKFCIVQQALYIHTINEKIRKVAKLSDYEQISHKILQCDKREIKNVRYLYEIRIK